MHKSSALTLVLVSKRDSDLEFVSWLRDQTNANLIEVGDVKELEDSLAVNKDVALFLDLDSGVFSSHGKFPHKIVAPVLSKTIRQRAVFGLKDDASLKLPDDSPFTHQMGHVFTRKSDSFSKVWALKLVKASQVDRPPVFEDFLDSGGELKTLRLGSTAQKTVAIEAFRRFLDKKDLSPKVIESVLTGLDEMIMNAIFDAPMDAVGRRYRREVSRSLSFPLNGREVVDVTLIRNPGYTILGVTDWFGSIDYKLTAEAVFQDFSGVEGYRPNPKTKSAHLGLQLISNSGLSFMSASKASEWTRSAIVFPDQPSLKALKESFRSFSLFGSF